MGPDAQAAQQLLKDLRDNLGLTAKDAAGVIPVGESTWRSYERGTSVPTEETLTTIDEKLVKRPGSGFPPGAAAAAFLGVGHSPAPGGVGSLGELMRVLEEAGFSAEHHPRDVAPEVVLWMHRLRDANLVHGVYALAAAAAIRSGIRVRLLLDDTEVNQHVRPGMVRNFRAAVDQWLSVAHANPARCDLRTFSEILPVASATEKGSELLERYLTSGTTVMEYLEASKVIPPRRADRTRTAELQAMSESNPRGDRLLTPFRNWIVLEHEVHEAREAETDGWSPGSVLTLGGEDERVLWRIWRQGTDPVLADVTGHLYLMKMPLNAGTPWDFNELNWSGRNHTWLARFIFDQVVAADGDPAMVIWLYRAGVLLPRALDIGDVRISEDATRLLEGNEAAIPGGGDDLRLVAGEIARAVVRWFAQS